MTSVFGSAESFIFVFKLVPTLIFVSLLAVFSYHIGLMQRIVDAISWVIYRIMGANGSEATSSTASVLIGQIEGKFLSSHTCLQ